MAARRIHILGGSEENTVDVAIPTEIEWAATPIMDSQKKTRRTRSTAPISIPIFAECAKLCEDPFWANVFDDASRGKLPARFSCIDGNLVYRNAGKNHVMSISNNPNEAALACIEFMYNHESIMSEEDIEKGKRLRYQPDPSAPSGDSWDELNKKFGESVMACFIESENETKNLNKEELRQLRQTVNFGQCLKYFHRDTIFMKNFKIIGIAGLLWDSNTRTYSIDNNAKPRETRSSSRRTSRSSTRAVTYGDKWERVCNMIASKQSEPQISIVDEYTGYNQFGTVNIASCTVGSSDRSDG